MKTKAKVATEYERGVRAKIDALYPKEGRLDADNIADARKLIENTFKNGSDGEQLLAQVCINDAVMRAVKDATEQGSDSPARLDVQRTKALRYFTSVRDSGRPQEKGAARLFLENVLAREIAKQPREISEYAVDGAHEALKTLWDPGSVGMLREAAEKVKFCGALGREGAFLMRQTADLLEEDSKRVPVNPPEKAWKAQKPLADDGDEKGVDDGYCGRDLDDELGGK